MNLRERLEIRAIVNLIIRIIESLAGLFTKVHDKIKPKVNPDSPIIPNRPRPLKRVIDKIDEIIPFPWRDNNE